MPEEFKGCPVCGVVGCEIHDPEEMMDPMKGMTNFLKAILGPDGFRDYSEGYGVMVNTGMEDEFVKVEDSEEESEVEVESGSETEEAGADLGGVPAARFAQDDDKWELPPPIPQGVGLSGGLVLYKEMEDKEVPILSSKNVDHYLDTMKDEAITGTDGKMHNLRYYRAKENGAKVLPIREQALKLVPRLKRQIQMAFEAEARVGRERGLKAGSVDSGRAHSLVSEGKADIFSKKSFKKTITSAVTIVLDDSGSMNESPSHGYSVTSYYDRMKDEDRLRSKAGCAAVLTYALGEVCKQLNIPFEVLSYQKTFPGWFDHYTIQYKGFQEPWDAVKDRLGSYSPIARVDVPYEAAVFGAKRLIQRREDRKIMFFLTDGDDYNVGVNKLGDLANELYRKAGIRMVGISICTQSLKKHMKEKAEAVMRLEELNDAVFSRLAKIIHPT